MYIDSTTIITIASVLGALSAISAVAYKAIKWFQRTRDGSNRESGEAYKPKGTRAGNIGGKIEYEISFMRNPWRSPWIFYILSVIQDCQ